MPVIGFLNSGSSNDAVWARNLGGFRRGLKEAGYVEGESVAIEFRWADGQYDLLPAMAEDLARRKVTVIFAGGDPAAPAAKLATATIPIVFTVAEDAVKLGLVASLNRPGGNVTGINLTVSEVESKRLGLLHDLVPDAAMVAILLNPKSPGFEIQSADIQRAARSIRQQILSLNASSEIEINSAFDTLVQQRAGALLVSSELYFNLRREQIVALSARHAIPAIHFDRAFSEAGGLISYGISFADGYRQAAIYVARILKGERPADLPVVLPTKFELVINLKTAKTLGLKIPPGVLAIADEVIE